MRQLRAAPSFSLTVAAPCFRCTVPCASAYQTQQFSARQPIQDQIALDQRMPARAVRFFGSERLVLSSRDRLQVFDIDAGSLLAFVVQFQALRQQSTHGHPHGAVSDLLLRASDTHIDVPVAVPVASAGKDPTSSFLVDLDLREDACDGLPLRDDAVHAAKMDDTGVPRQRRIS